MQINVEELERSTQFQQGRELPSPKVLHDALCRLDKAKLAKRDDEISSIEAEILSLVPKAGIYDGYLEDVGLERAHVRVNSIYRKGNGANIHTFHIKLDVLGGDDGTDVVEVRDMELISFLTPVNRPRRSGGQQVGPRFWPF